MNLLEAISGEIREAFECDYEILWAKVTYKAIPGSVTLAPVVVSDPLLNGRSLNRALDACRQLVIHPDDWDQLPRPAYAGVGEVTALTGIQVFIVEDGGEE